MADRPMPDSHSKRSDELLDELQSIILAEGFSKLRIGPLATRLHCSRTTLYRLAPTKSGLVLLVLDRLSDASYRDATAAASAPGLSAAEQFAAHVAVAAQYYGSGSPAFWRDVNTWPPAHELLDAKIERGVSRMREYIEEGIASGELRPLNAEFTARIIASGARIANDPEVLRRSGLTPDAAVRQLGDMIVGALKK